MQILPVMQEPVYGSRIIKKSLKSFRENSSLNVESMANPLNDSQETNWKTNGQLV